MRSVGRGRVLVVEDDDELRPSLVDALSGAGFDVSAAVNGRHALELLASAPRPDAILLDLMMPVMNGWEFRAWQKRDAALSGTPVVVITASESPQAASIDATRVLTKPFSLRELVDVVRGVVHAGRIDEPAYEDERMRSLAMLADGVASRINAPIGAILASLRAVQESLLRLNGEPNVRERAKNAVLDGLEQTDALRRVVYDLYAFSRADDRVRAPVDVRTVLESCITMLICRSRTSVEFRADHASVPPVIANQARLVTLLTQILTNALEAARHEVETRLFARGRDVLIEVRDDGGGMTPSVRRRVFDPFFSTKPAEQGSGLGLCIAHGIASSLAGRIEVESCLGHGTTFRIVLPAGSGVLPRTEY